MDRENIKKIIINATFPSDAMKKYLIQNQDISDRQLLEILCGAPIQLQLKHEFLNNLIAVLKDKKDISICQNRLELLDDAISQLTLSQSEIFLLVNRWYDPADGESCANAIPCTTLEDALAQIRKSRHEDESNLSEQELEEYTPYDWFELCSWKREVDSQQREHFTKGKYTYTIFGEDVCLFRSNNHEREEFDPYFDISFEGSTHLNLPVPFQTGDIVMVDCRPMGEKIHAVILETGRNQGSCDIQIAYLIDGNVRVSALKHSHCFKNDYYSGISSLYRLELYDGELPKENRLQSISETLKRFPPEQRDRYGAGIGYACIHL
ncbi:MAG: hypothetical protein LUH07_08945 [Lachnospiraceae bacterium]|nr:hypothetical protein [Lachnospiraceae bacterium]